MVDGSGMLSAGSPIELEASIEGTPHWFGGTIERSAEDALALRFPNRGRARPFEVGSNVHIDVVERGDVLSFESSVVSMTTTEESLIVEVRAPDSVTTLGRNFFRLTWRVPVTLQWDGSEKQDALTLETEDIGAGGIGVVSPQRVEVGRRATLTLNLGGKGEVEVRAWVVRAHQVALSEPARYRIGLVFEEMPVRMRDRLIGFIFEKQREIRRRELDGI
jgi:c-di-GMP-binding flagellar brake protein YcgR